ncbi:MAG: amino acid ABC transporter permease [Anaerolineae bacterium]|nr:amino acid ABC transporter permease [Anaerolineae bacterium]MDW8069956.1 amino acid ABC transporter permease [Anaerolineae bacterium]
MESGGSSESLAKVLQPDLMARRRGRIGLAIPWEHIPWWGIIVLLVGVVVGFSALTNTRYIDALYFIFDLPWNKTAIARGKVDENGRWQVMIQPGLAPGAYTLYAQFNDREGNFVGRSEVYHIVVPEGVSAKESPPIIVPSPQARTVDTSTPTLAGESVAGYEVIVYDDFSHNLWRVLTRIATANGVLLTIRTTLLAYAGALVLGLIFGVMRVTNRSPNLLHHAGRRVAVGLALALAVLAVVPAARTLPLAGMVMLGGPTLLFLLPALPYTISTLYVEVVRGVPMLVIILYMGFAVTPALRESTNNVVDLRGWPAALIGLAFGYGAYLAEVFRAGIQSIPRGQMEAARSLGMSYMQAMRYVILPQAVRVVLPPLGNDFISMLKDSSLISVIALPEVLQQGRLWISRNFRAFEGFNSVVMVYLVMTLLLSLMVRTVERKTSLPGR